MNQDDLELTENRQQEAASGAEPSETVKAAEGSADVDVAEFVDQYADITDTMVAGKTVTDAVAKSAPRETVAISTGKKATAETVTIKSGKSAPTETVAIKPEKSAPTETIAVNTDEAGLAEQAPQDEKKSAEEDKNNIVEAEVDPEIEAIKEKIRERKREKIRKARARRIRFWTIFIFLIASIGAFIFSISGFFTVDSIEVKGNNHFTAEEIINIAHAVPGHNLIYNPDKQEIIDYLEQNPYIKSAEVTRKLPSTLVITVHEREQACAFKYDDDYLIMDDEGILLKKTRTEPMITMLKGFVVNKMKLGEPIGTDDPRMFTNTLKLIRDTRAADLYFVRIDMTSYEEDSQVRAYIYDNLVVRSDYDSLITNLGNGRLHKVVEKLFEDGVKRGAIIIGEDGSISFEPGI